MSEVTERELALQVHRVARALDSLEKRREWSAYAHPYRFLFLSFLNGLMIALGSTIGFAVVLYLLNVLGYLPVVGDVFEYLGNIATR